MTNPMIRIHNIESDQIIDREMNAEEMKQAKADKLKDDVEREAIEAAIAQEITAKAALLAKLGITADEAKLLLS